jgi:hypothetical protein
MVDGRTLIVYHYQSFQLVSRTALLERGVLSRDFHPVQRNAALMWTMGVRWGLDRRELELHWDEYASEVADAVSDLRALEPSVVESIVHLNPLDYVFEAYRSSKQLLPLRLRRPARLAADWVQKRTPW